MLLQVSRGYMYVEPGKNGGGDDLPADTHHHQHLQRNNLW